MGLNILLLLRQVRSFPDATVLAVGEFSAIDRRIHAYMAGADNACPRRPARELAAVLQAIRRKGWRGCPACRHGPGGRRGAGRRDGGSRASGCFRTAAGCWRPPMARVDLRKSERTLLQWFAHHEGMEARRNDTISAADGSSITGRSIDVVISRLKRRAEMLGVTLPIRSVRGRGYVFVGHLSVGRNEHSLEEGWRWGLDGCRAGSQVVQILLRAALQPLRERVQDRIVAARAACRNSSRRERAPGAGRARPRAASSGPRPAGAARCRRRNCRPPRR